MTAQIKPAPTWDHPAKWSKAILDVIGPVVAVHVARVADPDAEVDSIRILDPFAGVGRRRLAEAIDAALPHMAGEVIGVDLQPEPHLADELTLIGDATAHPDAWAGLFDAVVTSPCYGNRMADSHNAEDRCRDCGGSGLERKTERRTAHTMHDAPCRTCKGAGVTLRNTYAHSLRRAGGELVPGSAAGMQWGSDYRKLHEAAIREMTRVTVEGGVLVINMSNHVRARVEQRVCEWWINELIVQGCNVLEVIRVATPRQRNGANGESRVDGELVIVVRTPTPRRLL